MATKTRPRRAKQQLIPGTEPDSFPDLDTAAEHYVEVRDDRCKLSKEEAEAHDNLLEKMKEHGLERYEYDGHIVTCVSKSKAVVKRKKDKEPQDGEE